MQQRTLGHWAMPLQNRLLRRLRRWRDLALLPALCLILAIMAGVAGVAHAAPRALAFRSIDALPPDSLSVLSLLQDKQGFIWIGTIEGGLARYDGKRVRKYANDESDPRSLPAGRVPALYNDGDGRIWIGTDSGLARFEPLSNDFTRYAPPGADRRELIVRCIASDGAGGLWLATWGGLQHFDPRSGKFRIYKAAGGQPGSLAHNDLNALEVDDRGGVWVGTWPGGMDYLAPGADSFKHYQLDTPELPNSRLNDVRALHMDSSHVLWIGTDAGLLHWKPGADWSTRQLDGPPAGRITHIGEDMQGDLWISTRAAGLWRWDRGDQRYQAFQHRTEDPLSLSSNAIYATLLDRTGTLWVGTFTDGVNRANLSSHGLARLIPRDIAPDSFAGGNFVRSLTGAPDGLLWIGMDDALSLFDPIKRSVLRQHRADPRRPGALSQNLLYSLYQQPDGPLWVGTAKGLNRLDQPEGPFRTVHFEGDSNDIINAIAPGSGGVLWLGTGGDLLRYDPASGAVQAFDRPLDASGKPVPAGVTALLEDRRRRLWSGNYFLGGLNVHDLNSGKVQQLRHDTARADSLSNDYVTCLYEDNDGTLWVGTKKGLNRLLPAADGSYSFRRYTGKGALGSTLIESIRSDKAGMLWVATLYGLSQLDPTSDNATDFSAEDGLTDGFYAKAAASGAGGMLYFGSINGITSVNPAIHSSASRPPQVAITEIAIGSQSLGSGALPPGVELSGSLTAPKALTLPWHAPMLSIEFAALHYAEPKRNGYRYRLDGFDRDWIEADSSRPIAAYTNLDPGQYRFRVIATNNKGVPSADEVVLPITIMPPFWHTWWFRITMAALLLTATFLLYRWRVRSLTAHAQRLEAQVAARTRELELSSRKLELLSATDPLTGIANRRTFDNTLAREWRRAARNHEVLAVAMLDIDHFKLYNDHYGHQLGDACLRQVAQLFAGSMCRPADMVARYGGEEFALIAPGTSVADALRIANRVCEALNALDLPHAASPLGRVTASIGVAAVTPHGETSAEALLGAADAALYRAKAAGRNQAMGQADAGQAASNQVLAQGG